MNTHPLEVAMKAVIFFLLLIHVVALIPEDPTGRGRMWCPPPKYQELRSKRVYNYSSAIISEIHGQTHYTPGIEIIDYWQLFFEGDRMARFLHHHIGVMGFDKLYLTVIYNVTLHPTPPTIEEIYPEDKFCVVDWFKLGVIETFPNPYFGPEEMWPKDPEGKPTQDLDYYKTLRGFNPIYNKIRNYTDWVAVMDIDEILIPVNFKPYLNRNWCSDYHPTLIQRATEQMLITATSSYLSEFKIMNESRHKSLPLSQRCHKGWSFSTFHNKCVPISAFGLPVHMWENDGPDHKVCDVMPNLRSRFPSGYLVSIHEPQDTDGQQQDWKSIYQTKYNPPLSGRSMHHNPSGGHSFQAPRHFHKRISLELGHNKLPRSHESTNFSVLVRDNKLQHLAESYVRCMTDLRFENYEKNF